MSGPLDNQRHELFAQAVARGESTTDAYVTAGYKPSDQNAYRVSNNPAVVARVRELLEHRAVKSDLTVGAITEALQRLAEKAETLGTASGIGQSKACLVAAARLNGLGAQKMDRIIETPEERRALVAALEAERAEILSKRARGASGKAH